MASEDAAETKTQGAVADRGSMLGPTSSGGAVADRGSMLGPLGSTGMVPARGPLLGPTSSGDGAPAARGSGSAARTSTGLPTNHYWDSYVTGRSTFKTEGTESRPFVKDLAKARKRMVMEAVAIVVVCSATMGVGVALVAELRYLGRVLGIVLIVVSVVGGAILGYRLARMWQKRRDALVAGEYIFGSDLEMSRGAPQVAPAAPAAVAAVAGVCDNTGPPKAKDGLELAEGDLTLEKALKRGNYGEVWRGQLTATGDTVAVKVLPPDSKSVAGSADLIAEINVMLGIRKQGKHENVVEILGYAFKPQPQLVLEFVPTGSLLDWLLQMAKDGEAMEESVAIDFSLQIAKGMKFIAECNVVHRDLAARNVLITEGKVLKITDFGLARVVQASNRFFSSKQNGYCIKKESNPTAFRWTPPESFKEMALSGMQQVPHTEKGDVWSFGVVVAEICRRGEPPYDMEIPELSKEKLVLYVLEGKRMQQGPMPGKLYALAKRCWEHEPKDRPTFAQVVKDLKK